MQLYNLNYLPVNLAGAVKDREIRHLRGDKLVKPANNGHAEAPLSPLNARDFLRCWSRVTWTGPYALQVGETRRSYA